VYDELTKVKAKTVEMEGEGKKRRKKNQLDEVNPFFFAFSKRTFTFFQLIGKYKKVQMVS
jgi:hypothetical protein